MALPTRTETAERAESASVVEVVRALRDVLDPRVTAMIAGVESDGLVETWASGQAEPAIEVERRLRDALHVVDFLLQQEAEDTIRAWFMGLNPELNDQVPALAIGQEPEEVLLVAGTFMAHG